MSDAFSRFAQLSDWDLWEAPLLPGDRLRPDREQLWPAVMPTTRGSWTCCWAGADDLGYSSRARLAITTRDRWPA